MPKVDPEHAPRKDGTGYPMPFNEPCEARTYRKLGTAAGLTDFGVNLVTIAPGSWSSQRHTHFDDDEFLVMMEGELVLIEDEGRTVMRAGDFAAFAKSKSGGHHLVNESKAPASFVVVGANKGGGSYPDIDLCWEIGENGYRHKDGRPYVETDYAPTRRIG
jgi:uncharacterized cupin superfamily protein